jgi:hypothetical protein
MSGMIVVIENLGGYRRKRLPQRCISSGVLQVARPLESPGSRMYHVSVFAL